MSLPSLADTTSTPSTQTCSDGTTSTATGKGRLQRPRRCANGVAGNDRCDGETRGGLSHTAREADTIGIDRRGPSGRRQCKVQGRNLFQVEKPLRRMLEAWGRLELADGGELTAAKGNSSGPFPDSCAKPNFVQAAAPAITLAIMVIGQNSSRR